jgi:hypothetical protein
MKLTDDETFKATVTSNYDDARVTITHALLASLDTSVAITTNYDRGYETAVQAAFGVPASVVPQTLPGVERSRTLIKLHGDVRTATKIVITRKDFATMQAFGRPLAAVLQESLLTGHLLAIGSSLSDPTIARAADEVEDVLKQAGHASSTRGTAVLTEADPVRSALLSPTFRSVVGVESPSEMLEGARRVDILLDHIAMRSSTGMNHLLQPEYDDLVPPEDQELVRRLRELSALADPRGSAISQAASNLLRKWAVEGS